MSQVEVVVDHWILQLCFLFQKGDYFIYYFILRSVT